MSLLPIFYEPALPANESFILSENTSKHIVQVLRMKDDDKIHLTNGKGELLVVQITKAHKRFTEVTVNSRSLKEVSESKITIGISLIKNPGRFEWFLEKATEIGIYSIIPLLCTRTEKKEFRYDRMNSILITAMLQSQQTWLPTLHQPTKFQDVVTSFLSTEKYIAHCNEGNKMLLQALTNNSSKIILIGPEGDFSKEEIDMATKNNYVSVSLGDTRLRTETAGILAAAFSKNYL